MLGQAALVDDMYDMLAAYEQKVPMTDQVRCRAMGEGEGEGCRDRSGGQHGRGGLHWVRRMSGKGERFCGKSGGLINPCRAAPTRSLRPPSSGQA